MSNLQKSVDPFYLFFHSAKQKLRKRRRLKERPEAEESLKAQQQQKHMPIQEDKARAKVKREAAKKRCSEFRDRAKNGTLFCTRENDPIRGLDGKTHGNLCSMCQAFFDKEKEERMKKEGENQRITSGHDSSGGRLKAKDECAQYWESMKNGEFSCTRESDPVRGADGKSYNNKCVMCKELLQREMEEKNKNFASRSNDTGSATRKDVCDQFRSQMKNGKLLCTRESDPTRGPDGKTHGNKCAMCKERLEREAAEKKKKEDEDKRNTGTNKNDKEDNCREDHNTAEDAKSRRARSSLPFVAGMSEDECSEFRKLLRDDKFLCPQKDDPVRGADGTIYQNKCHMCKVVL
ncbi:serine peptidase inhibitor Kazal type 5 [Cricetulus griseus]